MSEHSAVSSLGACRTPARWRLGELTRRRIRAGILQPFYEQEVVKSFRQTNSRIIGRLPCSPSPVQKRVIGSRAGRKPGASEPLTRRRVQYAGEGWRALLRSPACKPVLVAYLPPSTFAAILSASPGLKPVIARVRPNVRLPSIRWRLASLILHARYAIFPGACPI